MKLLALTLTTLLFSFNVMAETPEKPYTKEAFQASQEKGEKIMLQVHAKWCPVCKNEDKVFEKLKKEDFFKHVTYYQADWDKELELRKELNVSNPGTLIIFTGKKEMTRNSGIQNEEEFKRFATTFFDK